MSPRSTFFDIMAILLKKWVALSMFYESQDDFKKWNLRIHFDLLLLKTCSVIYKSKWNIDNNV